MWDLSSPPGIEPESLALADGFLTTEPAKSWLLFCPQPTSAFPSPSAPGPDPDRSLQGLCTQAPLLFLLSHFMPLCPLPTLLSHQGLLAASWPCLAFSHGLALLFAWSALSPRSLMSPPPTLFGSFLQCCCIWVASPTILIPRNLLSQELVVLLGCFVSFCLFLI